MAQSLFDLRPTKPAGLVEFPDKIVVGYQYFKSSNLTSPTRINLHLLTPTDVNVKWSEFKQCACAPGSQIALGSLIQCRNFAGTITYNPNLNSEFQMMYGFENTTFIAGFKSGMQRFIVNNDTLKVGAILGVNSNQEYIGALTKITNTDFLSIINDTYYDKVYSSYRDYCDGIELKNIHNYKQGINNGTGGFLAKTSSSVFMYFTYHGNGFKVQKYSISSQSITDLVSSSRGNYHTAQPSNFFEKASTNTQKIFYVARVIGTNQFVVEKYTLDLNAEKCTKEDCTINGNPDVFLSVSESRFSSKCWVMYDSSNDKYYLNVMFFARFDYNPDISNFRLYTFELDPTNPSNLTFVTQYNFTQQPGGFLYLNNDKTKIVVTGMSDCEVLSFQDKWTSLRLGTGSVKVCIYDNYGRLWVLNELNEVFMLLPQLPAQIIIKPKDTELEYTGSTITTKVYISAYNYEGKRVAVNGTLKILSDNAEFQDGSKVKSVTTSSTNDVEVDINITGPGILTIAFDVDYTL